MNIKKNYVLRKVANTWIVLPLGEEAVNFGGMLTLNDSGAMLWKALKQGGDRDALVSALTQEYEVSYEEACTDVDAFLEKLIQAGCMENP